MSVEIPFIRNNRIDRDTINDIFTIILYYTKYIGPRSRGTTRLYVSW